MTTVQQTPRNEALFADLDEVNIPAYLDPEQSPTFLSVENSSELLEHEMLRTLLDIMQNGRRDSDRRSAASDVGEIIGKKGKQAIQLIKAENVQINQIEQNPEIKAHLISAAKGLAQISEGHASNINSKFGGKGV